MEYKLDAAWEAVNALGGTVAAGDIHGKGYVEAVGHALAEIEKLGGMDPLERKRQSRDELPNCARRSIAPCDECGGMGEYDTQHSSYGSRMCPEAYVNVKCAACDGRGKIEIEVEPVTLDDL